MNIDEQEWKDMKAKWRESSVAEVVMTQQLRWGLRLRMVGSRLYLGLEAAGFLLVGALGVIQMAMGQSGAGMACIALVLVCLGASIWARRATLRGASGSLPELVELAMRRARRGARMAWANYFMTLATAAAILGLYFSSIGDPRAAYHDGARVAVAMGLLAAYAIGVGVYHAYARRRVRKFSGLRAQLGSQESE